MIKKKVLTLVCGSFMLLLLAAWLQGPAPFKGKEEVRRYILNELTALNKCLDGSLNASHDLHQLRKLYHTARKHYKRVEFFVEYCSTREAKYLINGPLVPKYDPELGGEVHYPNGFQRIEELLFDDSQSLTALRQEYGQLKSAIEALRIYYSSLDLPDHLVLEMCQLQLFRIVTANLNGYDATITFANVQEAGWNLEGIANVIESYASLIKDKKSDLTSFNLLKDKIGNAMRYLQENPSYDQFDRLYFITRYIQPLYEEMIVFHNACGLPWDDRKMALDLREKGMFDRRSFNLRYFSMYYDDTLRHAEQATLGKMLFFDPVLSGNNQRSCASCHNPSMAFTDGKVKSKAMDGITELERNAPTLLNVVFQRAFFYDGRAYQLEQQISDVLHNREEMQSSLEEAVERLKMSSEYKRLFREAFMGSSDTAISAYAIQKAITEYEKELVTFNSRFDKYLHGNYGSMNSREVNGYNIFAGKALCGSCHFMPLFNGTVPPLYSDTEFEVLGTPATADNKNIDEDPGRFRLTQVEEQMRAFKTPTLRNISMTAPYMHNGVYETLEAVLEFYHKGGGAGLGMKTSNQTLPFDSLQLSATEKEDILLFLRTLTDSAATKVNLPKLPEFDHNSPFNQRKVGGSY
jgi:cytochrome c peroxidase